jgi:hypothetical protein
MFIWPEIHQALRSIFLIRNAYQKLREQNFHIGESPPGTKWLQNSQNSLFSRGTLIG